ERRKAPAHASGSVVGQIPPFLCLFVTFCGHSLWEATMSTRRQFLGQAAGAVGYPLLAGLTTAAAVPSPPEPAPLQTGSDVGSLFPFIQSQAVRGEFPLSFLRDEFKNLDAWKRQARGKLLDLLHYAPPPCEPRPEVVEQVDRGDHVRE